MRIRISVVVALVLASLCGVALASDAAALIEEGNRLWTQGQLDEALQRYQAASEADPKSVDAYIKSAGVLYAKQEYRAGVVQFQKAIGIDPKNANAFIGIAIGYLHTGQDGPAYAALEEAVRLDPSKYERVRPLMERIEGRVPQMAPTPGMTDEQIEEHLEGMK
jgi:tetratricopeptide (TPR) repeat protein